LIPRRAPRKSHTRIQGLRNLGLERVDALLLRGPSEAARRTGTLDDSDKAAWAALQAAAARGAALLIGVCNFPPKLLGQLAALDGPRLAVHQTRLRADRAWRGAASPSARVGGASPRVGGATSRKLLGARRGSELARRSADDRAAAAAHGVLLQAPALASSNRPALARGSALFGVAGARGQSPERTLFQFAAGLGVVPVVGASSALHVRDDLDALEGRLSKAEVKRVLDAAPDKPREAWRPPGAAKPQKPKRKRKRPRED